MNESVKLIVPEDRRGILPRTDVSESQAIMNIIAVAARDPDVDIDKMERLLTMHQKMVAQKAEADYNAALNACQAEMSPIAADAENPQTRSRYASYAQLDRAIRPIYIKHGFAISFDEADCPKPDYVRVLGLLSHKGGHTHVFRTDMPADGKGAKGGDVMTKTHAVGAAKSYGKRYILKDAFNISVAEDDADGNDLPECIDKDQIAALEKLITEVKADKAKFLKYLKIDSLEHILAASYTKAVALLEAKRAKK
jgi:hypothetical protein